MSECEINPCVKQEYESELTPITTGFNLVERMTPQTIPNQNTIYSNGDDLFVWDGEKYVPMVGRGCNLPLDIQLYGTWTGHLDELVFEGQATTQQTDTGINIQNAPNDLIYFFFTVECDGEYGEDVDLVADNVWSGATMGWFGRSYVNGNLRAYSSAGYNKVVRPQNVNNLLTDVNSGSLNGISLNNSNEKVLLYRSVSGQGSYSVRRIMGGNYTVNVYALKLGNFQ